MRPVPVAIGCILASMRHDKRLCDTFLTMLTMLQCAQLKLRWMVAHMSSFALCHAGFVDSFDEVGSWLDPLPRREIMH